jgi:hypothetical protein
MKKVLDGEGAVNFVSRRFFAETMLYPSIPSLGSTGTALLEHILLSYSDMEERNE